MYALKALISSLGSKNIDCRQDGAALDPSFGRSSYLFNPTIQGIESADALPNPMARTNSIPMPTDEASAIQKWRDPTNAAA